MNAGGYGRGEIEPFSSSSFKQHVKEEVHRHLEDGESTAEQCAELWRDINDDIFAYLEDGREEAAFHRMNEFSSKDLPDLFTDCWEWR